MRILKDWAFLIESGKLRRPRTVAILHQLNIQQLNVEFHPQRSWPSSPSPRPDLWVRYFAHRERQAKKQSSNLISDPQGTDFNCNEVQRSSSLRTLRKAVKVMVKGNWQEIYGFIGYKGYPGGCPHFSGEKWGQWQLERILLSQTNSQGPQELSLERSLNLIEFLCKGIYVLRHCWKQQSN